MAIGNMRANSAPTLAVWCVRRRCGHHRAHEVNVYAGDVPVPSFGPGRGHLGADARPNWNEMHKREPITRASGGSDI
jgi:hypothetical protein